MNAAKHLRFGWWMLATFLTLGIALESFHGFKVGWYLDVGNDTRRLMFRLAHAHGTLLGVVNVVAALTVRAVSGGEFRRGVSSALVWGSILVPVGFLLGGFAIRGGDPGIAVALVPVGALLLLYAVVSIARSLPKP